MNCKFEGCENSAFCKGLCRGHYTQKGRGKILTKLRPRKSQYAKVEFCTHPGCERPINSLGLCRAHYVRHKKGKDMNKPFKIASRGSRYKNRDGYIELVIPEHPMADSYGRVREHRKIFADSLGRSLFENETVHHKNGKRDDNRLENLELWVTTQPSGQRVEDRIADALEILNRYAPHLLINGSE